MKASINGLKQLIAGCLVTLLAVPFADAANASPQQTAPAQQTTPAQQTAPAQTNSTAPQTPPQTENGSATPGAGTPQPAAIPDSPGAVREQQTTAPQTANPQTGNPQSANPQTANPQTGNPQTAPPQQQQPTQPLGTAAAPYETTTGVAASRPAGAAIAPAKQKRSRSFVIKVSLLVGAAIAVGTVVALSKGSPSRPTD